MEKIIKQCIGIDCSKDELAVCFGQLGLPWLESYKATGVFENSSKGFKPFVILIYSFVILIYSFVVLIFPFVILLFPFAILIYSTVILMFPFVELINAFAKLINAFAALLKMMIVFCVMIFRVFCLNDKGMGGIGQEIFCYSP